MTRDEIQKRRELIYAAYVSENKTGKQIADEFKVNRKTVCRILRYFSQKNADIDNEDKVKLALDKILLRIQKFQDRIDNGDLSPKQEVAFYDLMLRHEKYASELDGLLQTGITIKESKVLLLHNVKGVQKALTHNKEKKING